VQIVVLGGDLSKLILEVKAQTFWMPGYAIGRGITQISDKRWPVQ
jgi:hypothetical protein